MLKHLKQHGCVLLREGEKHSIFTTTGMVDRRTSAVTRHVEIADLLARKMCRDLGIEPPASAGPFR
ncbi:MAG: hypothetical protein M3P94_02995, partial [Chloroflexota bacterium]|nr:hypothetical protein [Chloroflexota bacterium]